MVHLTHGGMNPRAEKPKMPAKELESIRITPTEDGAHVAEHHFSAFEHPPEQHANFKGMEEKHPVMEGHLFHHLAQHLGIPHSVIEAKSESADKIDAKGHEPDEEEELEGE